jgi:glycosyltransferase involved in cell wall biosynthesis
MNLASESNISTKVISDPKPLRVLVASHGHPKITNGGAEIAAFRLFSGLSETGAIQAWFLGCNTQPGGGRDGIALTQPFTEREYVYCPEGRFDWFRFSNGDIRLPGELKALLIELQPDVVHLHHYVNFGVEVIWTIRQTLPRARIVVTLHEYQAICNHFGQMVKRGQFSLCDRSGREECHKCFPEIDASEFFLRDRYIRTFFDMVDHFISPSQFLLNRYVDWGIERSRLSLIENIIAPPTVPPEKDVADASLAQPLRIGFFGQISKLKGISVLLECALILSAKTNVQIVFDIYGDYKGQPQEFQDEFLDQLEKVSSNVNYRGAYRQDQIDRLMRTVDAVLVPSIWWENSPVVIQEAFRNDRPVICSNIGGMAEKVRDGADGFHFTVGSGLELSYLLQKLHDDRNILRQLRDTVQRPPKVEDVLAQHLKLYKLLAEKMDDVANVSEGRQ